ncbi:MAG: MurT ligase domain-containing protein [Chloroflexota bacterium]
MVADSSGVVEQVRLALALSAGKLVGRAGRLMGRGGGTSLPGAIARTIDPHVLRKVVGASTAKKLVVTGSNGKTTTCRMVAALVGADGRTVVQNRTGSNLLQGVTSVAVNGATMRGHLDADVLIFEIDEATMRHAVPEIEPDVVIITNIFRDQMDRYGELYSVAGALESMICSLTAQSTVVLNGDDPLIANFAPDASARRIHFGLSTDDVGSDTPEHAADSIRCPRCQHDLGYNRAYMSHLGSFHCEGCGYARPPLDVVVTSIRRGESGSSDITIETPSGPMDVTVPLPGLHNVYNAAGAVAAGIALGLELSGVNVAFSGMKPAFGRLEAIRAGDKNVILAFVKNPISYNTTVRTILERPGDKHILAVHSNTVVDGEDFSWLWDVDLEVLAPQISTLITGGTKGDEVAMRYKYAGVPESRMNTVHDEAAALDAALVETPSGETLYILAGYTPTRHLRGIMQSRGWVAPFWEE